MLNVVQSEGPSQSLELDDGRGTTAGDTTRVNLKYRQLHVLMAMRVVYSRDEESRPTLAITCNPSELGARLGQRPFG